MSLRKRGSLLIRLNKGVAWLAPYDGNPGRPAVLFDVAIQFCPPSKFYSCRGQADDQDGRRPLEAGCRVAFKSGHPQFVCHGLTEFHRLKGSGRGIEEALGSNRQRRGW